MGCSRNLSLRRRDEPSPIARSLVVVLEGRRSQPASQSPPSWVIDPVTPCFARPPYNLLLGLHEIMPYQKPRHHQPGLQQNHDHRPSIQHSTRHPWLPSTNLLMHFKNQLDQVRCVEEVGWSSRKPQFSATQKLCRPHSEKTCAPHPKEMK